MTSILAWIKAQAYKLGKVFVDADYLAQMAHIAWAAMFCYAFTFWASHSHWLNPHTAVVIAALMWMVIWATPKEFWYDPTFEKAPFLNNLLDWSVYLAGCLSVVIPVLVWA